MATFKKSLATLILLLCFVTQVRAADMWRNLEDLNGFDGYIASNTPNSFTDNETLLVTYLDATRWSMLRFNVSTLPDVPQVQSAKLWLWTENPGLNVSPASMYMHPLYVPFSSATTWNNKNISVYAGATNVPVGGWNSWTVIDVTTYYQKWRSGQWTNHGIILSPNLAQPRFFNWFASANYVTTAAKKPRLQVTYTGSVAPPPVGFLSFPLNTTTLNSWKTAPLISIMDHAKSGVAATVSGNVDSNVTVRAFNGESASNYPGNYLSVWCPYRSVANNYLTHPVGGNIPYVGDSSAGCLGKQTLTYNGHNGFDYATPTGTPVYAAATGVVTENQCTGIGNTCSSVGRVILKHVVNINGVQKTFYTWYMHLSKAVLANGNGYVVGQTINEGQRLGLSGLTGAGTAQHLHFEVRIGGNGTTNTGVINQGVPVDPFGWYGGGADPLSTTDGYKVVYTSEGYESKLLWK